MIDSVAQQAGAGADLKKTQRTKTTTARNIDRLPPYSPEAEQGVLGCCLLSPNDCVPGCLEKLKAGAEVFYDLRHQEIFKTLAGMFEKNEPIDVITLQQRLKDNGLLENIGGIPYLNSLQDAVPSAANLDYYIGIVIEKFCLRTMLQTCTEVVGRIYDYEGEVPQLMDEVQHDVLKWSDITDTTEVESAKTLVQQSMGNIEACYNQQGQASGIATGFQDLDKMTDGLHGGELVVIAARPSLGKTSLAMNIAEHVVLEHKLPVGVFSLEMTAESLMTRMLCSCARVNLRTIKDGFMAESDFTKLASAAGKMSNAPLFIDDTAGLSILQLRARARRMWQQFGIKLFIVDYLQLMHSATRRAAENRVQEVSDISSGLKALAKDLGVPVVVLSQLNRELEKRNPGSKPRLADLRESGSIEQDADVVGLLYKPGAVDEDESEQDGIAVNLLIAKQRNGPTGDVHLTFLKPYTRFESAAKIVAADAHWQSDQD